jgi:hypothetical protein
MKLALIRGVLLLVTFVVAFFITTVLSDALDKHNGYYNDGIQESKSYDAN